MNKVIVYSKAGCAYCTQAKQFLSSHNIAYEEIRVDLDTGKLEEMIKLSGRRSVPQIFINDKSIGGYDDLVALKRSGKLDGMLNDAEK